MLLIGLTGSIATGKSTVSRLLSQIPYSLPVIDADLLARRVVEPGTHGYNAILDHFASTTPDLLLSPSLDHPPSPLGQPLNRQALGKRVFGDSDERRRDRAVLNGIVHPAVRWAMAKLVAQYYMMGHWAVVLDIPLLFESGLDVFCGTVLVVGVRDAALQMRRLRERDPHLSEQEARDRVGSQGDVRVKARRAEARGRGGRGVVVWNDGGKEELKEGVKRVMEGLRGGSPRWWGWLLLLVPPLAMGWGIWNIVVGWWARRSWVEGERREKAKL